MSKRAYLPQYTSPNITLVPNVSFAPPRKEYVANPTNISLFSCDPSAVAASVRRRSSINYSNLRQIVVEPSLPSSDESISHAGASVNVSNKIFKHSKSQINI